MQNVPHGEDIVLCVIAYGGRTVSNVFPDLLSLGHSVVVVVTPC